MKLILLSLFALLLNLPKGDAQEIYLNERLEKLWETKAGLHTPESVLYDPSEKMLYVSSINEHPWEKDNNGYITRHKPDGDIVNYNWVEDMLPILSLTLTTAFCTSLHSIKTAYWPIN